MKDRVRRGIMFSLSFVVLVLYFSMVIFIYQQDLNLMKFEVRQEAKYIRTAINISGPQYLEKLDKVDENTRITRIDRSGKVLYDSKGRKELENHKYRKEVREAFLKNQGEDIRISSTLKKNMYYYALLADDGSVIRVSRTMYNMQSIAMDILPIMSILFIVVLFLSWVIAKWQTRRIVDPINNIDLDRPLDVIAYPELEPLLIAIDRQNKQKDAIANMRKEFSANVSHELKTPLTSISGYAEIMKNGMVKEKDIKNFSERIYKEASRLIKLVNDIINISKLDEGYVSIEKESVDLFDLVGEISTRLSKQAHDKRVRMIVEGESVNFFGVRQILDEMIYNIVENAIKYNKELCSVRIWVRDTLNGAKISIRDAGIFIPEEVMGIIFERFYRVDKIHSKDIGGTGLGLSIVKHGAMIHGASVRSEERRVGKECRSRWSPYH